MNIYAYICICNFCSLLNQLPLSIESRLSSLSSSEEIFNDSVTPCQDALDKLGYKHKLKYQANTDTGNNKKQRKEISSGSIHRTGKT